MTLREIVWRLTDCPNKATLDEIFRRSDTRGIVKGVLATLEKTGVPKGQSVAVFALGAWVQRLERWRQLSEDASDGEATDLRILRSVAGAQLG